MQYWAQAALTPISCSAGTPETARSIGEKLPEVIRTIDDHPGWRRLRRAAALRNSPNPDELVPFVEGGFGRERGHHEDLGVPQHRGQVRQRRRAHLPHRRLVRLLYRGDAAPVRGDEGTLSRGGDASAAPAGRTLDARGLRQHLRGPRLRHRELGSVPGLQRRPDRRPPPLVRRHPERRRGAPSKAHPPCGSSSWERTAGAATRSGRPPGRVQRIGTCAPTARCAASPGEPGTSRHASTTTQRTLSRRWVVPCSWPPSTARGRGISGRSRADPTCSSTRARPWRDLYTVLGPVYATLFAASSAPDTDFVARLVDVYPDGRAICVADGILRASARESYPAPGVVRPVAPSPIEPGEVYEYVIDLWATGITFLPGHRIRVEITSSSHPRWERNLNTGESALRVLPHRGGPPDHLPRRGATEQDHADRSRRVER